MQILPTSPLELAGERDRRCVQKDRRADTILWEVPLRKDPIAILMPGRHGHEHEILMRRGAKPKNILTIECERDKYEHHRNLGLSVTSRPLRLEDSADEVLKWAYRGVDVAYFDLQSLLTPRMAEALYQMIDGNLFAHTATLLVTTGAQRPKPDTVGFYMNYERRTGWANGWPCTLEILKDLFGKANFHITLAKDYPYPSFTHKQFVISRIEI